MGLCDYGNLGRVEIGSLRAQEIQSVGGGHQRNPQREYEPANVVEDGQAVTPPPPSTPAPQTKRERKRKRGKKDKG